MRQPETLTCRFCLVYPGRWARVAEPYSVDSQNSEGVVDIRRQFEVSCRLGSRDLSKIMPVTSMVQGVFILNQKFCVKKKKKSILRMIYLVLISKSILLSMNQMKVETAEHELPSIIKKKKKMETYIFSYCLHSLTTTWAGCVHKPQMEKQSKLTRSHAHTLKTYYE